MSNAFGQSEENSSNAPSLSQSKESIKRLLGEPGEKSQISIDQLNKSLQSVLKLISDIESQTQAEIQSRLRQLDSIEESVDTLQFLTDQTGAMTPLLNFQRPQVKQQISAARGFLNQTFESKAEEGRQVEQKNRDRSLSDKIRDNADLPISMREQLSKLESLSQKAETEIASRTQNSYFDKAPMIEIEIYSQLENKDKLVDLLQAARRDKRLQVPVELIPEYDIETQQIGLALNERIEVRSAEAIRHVLFQIWRESLAYQQNIAELRTAMILSDLDSKNQSEIILQLKNLQTTLGLVKSDPQLQSKLLPGKYFQEIQAAIEKIPEIEKTLHDEWTKKAEAQYFDNGHGNLYSLKNVRERYGNKFSDEAAYSRATQTDLDALNRGISTLSAAANADWPPGEGRWWTSEIEKLQEIARKISDALATKQLEKTHQDEVNAKKEKLRRDFLEKLEQLSRGPAAVIQTLQDTISKRLSPLYDELSTLNKDNIFSFQEILEVERKLWIADYLFTKRSLHQTLADNELNEANKDFYLAQDGYVAQYQGNGFDRLTGLIHKLSQVNGVEDKTILQNLERDIATFKNTIDYRRTFLFAGLYHKGEIIGTVHEGKSVAKIPAAPAPLFPDDSALTASDRPSARLPQIMIDGVTLRFPGEHEFNPEGKPRNDDLQDFAKPGTFAPIENFVPSAFGDVKRLLDMMFNNRLHVRLKKAIEDQNREPTAQEVELISIFKDYFKSQHLPEWNDNLNRRISQAAEVIYGYKIDPLTAKEAWYSHILKLNQEMLIPGSSQFQDNQIYKANQALTYLLEAVREVSTSGFDLFRLLMLIGIFSNDGDLNFWLSQTVDSSKLSDAKGVIEKIGYAIAGVPSGKNARDISHAIKEVLHEEGLDEFRYLADLPLMETARTEWGTFPFIPLPMQFELFKDRNGQKLSTIPGETAILRFGDKVEGRDPKPVTAADFINSQGDIMYELIPHEDRLKDTDIQTWYNNGPNFTNFYKLYASGLSAEDLSYDKLAGLFNQEKYAGIGLPGGWGEEVRCGSIDGKKATMRVGSVYVLGTCFSLLMSGRVQTFHDLEKKLNDGFTKAVSPEATKAIMAILRKTLGSEAEARTYGEELGKQIEEFLKIR